MNMSVMLRLANVNLAGHPAVYVIFKCLPKEEYIYKITLKILIGSDRLKFSGAFLHFLYSSEDFFFP